MKKINSKSKPSTPVSTSVINNDNFCLKSKRSQEEMVGFGIIIVIVAVIILLFLRFSLTNNKESSIESYEAENFVLGVLQQTTDCQNNQEFLNVNKLIFGCYNNNVCEDGRDSCEVLSNILTNILEKSWDVTSESQYKGYKLEIQSNGENMINITEGKLIGNSKGTTQDFSRSGNDFQLIFTVYN